MKKATIALATTIFLMLIFVYTLREVSPWNKEIIARSIEQYSITTNSELRDFIAHTIETGLIWQVLDLKNIILFFLLLGGIVVSLVTAVHLFIDKLFFRKFFEEPDLALAIRRGSLVFLYISALIALRLFAALYWYNFILVTTLLITMEIVLTHSFSEKGAEGEVQELKQLNDINRKMDRV